MDKYKIIFAGTPDFACPALEALLKSPDFEVAAVITQEDKKIGRKQIITPPPVKVLAEKHGCPVYQSVKVKELSDRIIAAKADFLVVIAYGQIIPKNILEAPKYGCINVHASLLPRWRGASVIAAPILHGDQKSGVTIMLMDEGLDTGPILAQKEIILEKNETAPSLHDKLSALGAEILPTVLKDFSAGKITPSAQDNTAATYIKMLKKEGGHIDWSKPAAEIERMARAYNPWPGTYSIINYKLSIINKIVKILEAENKILQINKFKIGEIFLHEDKLAVQCGDGAMVLKTVQLEGKKALSAEEFLRGQPDFIGRILS